MNTLRWIVALTPVWAFAIARAQSPSSPAEAGGPYQVAATWHVGGPGGWDYVTVDPAGNRIFLPRSTHTMVLDLTTGRVLADIPGQKRNHGVALVPSVGRGFISDGGDGSVTVFDLKTYAVLGKIRAERDADGIIYDPASNKVLVVSGDGGALIPISPDVDPRHGQADPPIDLGGKPEYLAADGRGRAYINLVNKDEVAVVDTRTMRVIGRWPTAPGGAPTGMSMDRAHRRLFIGCRRPQKLVVMNADDGKVVADFPIGAGVDATRFDGDAFASCRDGTLTIIREATPDHFVRVQDLKTAPGARTMGLDAQSHTLYLPAAEFEPRLAGRRRPALRPGSFKILVVRRSGPAVSGARGAAKPGHGEHPKIYAQKLVDQTVARHPHIKSVELSLLSGKGGTTVAATASEDIGEACDLDENTAMTTGKPYVEAPTKDDPVYDITQALHDASGRLIGAVGMDIDPAGRSRGDVLAQARAVLREMEKAIPSRDKLLASAAAN